MFTLEIEMESIAMCEMKIIHGFEIGLEVISV